MQTRCIGALVFLMIAMRMASLAHAGEHGAALSRDAAGGGPPGMQVPAAGEARVLDVTASPPRVESKSYWLQILAIDAASIAVAIATEHPAPLLGNLLGSPIVHAVHRNKSSLFISPALRVGLPLLGATLGPAFADCNGELFCGMAEVYAGALIGAGAAIILDYALLANERVEVAPAQGLSIAPSMSASADSLALGLSGRF